jgi:hypothetical protein
MSGTEKTNSCTKEQNGKSKKGGVWSKVTGMMDDHTIRQQGTYENNNNKKKTAKSIDS